MKKKSQLLIIILFSWCIQTVATRIATEQSLQLRSPGGHYLFEFRQDAHQLLYSISYKGKKVVEAGQLGVEIDNHLAESAMGIKSDSCLSWTDGMELQSVERAEHDATWQPLYGERKEIRDHYRQLTLHLTKGNTTEPVSGGYNRSSAYSMDIIVRAYDEGIAFRYHFPETSNGLFLHITEETTTFSFADGVQGYHESWAQGPYHLTGLYDWEEESERPLLLKHPNGLYTAILEASLADFPRGKIKLAGRNCLQMSLHSSADVITPYDMPWRVVMATEKPVDLINNKDIILNLSPSCAITDTSFIRPGKVFRSQLNRADIIKSIDLAAAFGMQFVELDAGWYGPEMKVSSVATEVAPDKDFDIMEICNYAHDKHIGIWLYVNQRALYTQLDSILPKFKAWGVSGIKFGFVQVGSQKWTTWLHEAVRRCAEYGLMVDIHDEYRPTGISRTYPNLMTQEGIRGNEEMPDATHNTLLPFTRFLCGPADYTLCYFNNRVKNTKAHQLAMAAVYFSPIQFLFWYDRPDAYRGEAELQFWRDIPTTFDESIALDGVPGEYIVQARRSGDDWYVGVMTNTEARDLTLQTSFLPKGKYMVTLYQDNPSLSTRTKVEVSSQRIKAGESLRLHLQPSGGAALRFKAER